MSSRFVLVHPDEGVFVGTCLGLAFWSLTETAGQDRVPTFATSEEALDFAARIPLLPADLEGDALAAPIECEGTFATADDLERAGLGHFVADMRENAKYQETP